MTGEKKEKLKKKEKVKFLRNLKYKKVIYKILKYILIIALIYNVISLANRAFFGKNYVSILGINFFSIDTNSMKGDLYKYSLVITKKSKSQDFKINDIIAYEVNDNIKINKIINKYYDENKGKEVYITKYNLNYYPDIEKVTYNQIVGKKVLHIPFLGWLIKLIRSEIFSVLCILILFVMFLENKAKMRRKKHKKSKKMSIQQNENTTD
mgnify:CR=1 FL=1